MKTISRVCAFFLSIILGGAFAMAQGAHPSSPPTPQQTVDSSSAGQRNNRSHLRGMVVDHTGSLVENYSFVEVRVVPPGNSGPADRTVTPMLSLQTDREGQFSADLPVGSYEICIRWFPKSCQIVIADEAPKPLEYLTLKISPGDEHPPEGLFESRLAALAGPDAQNCGTVVSHEHARQATRCALHAFKRHLAFYVSYDPSGIRDSFIAEGLASDGRGSVNYVDYDSMGIAPVGLGPSVTAPDGFHTLVTACAHPARLRKTHEGKLKCFANGRWIGGY